MFWNNLNPIEQRAYFFVMKRAAKWIAWVNTDTAERGPEPPTMSDLQWITMDRLAAKGWRQTY